MHLGGARPTTLGRMIALSRHQTARNRRSVERRLVDGVAILGGVGVLVACGLVARNGKVGALEADAFRVVNSLPDALTPVMRGAQYLGVLVVGPAVAIGALGFRRYRLALAAVIVTVAKLGSERIVWRFVVR